MGERYEGLVERWKEHARRIDIDGTPAQVGPDEMDCLVVATALSALLGENARLTEALEAMLRHSCVADSGADMKDAEDHAAERRARAALSATGASEDSGENSLP